MRLLQSIIEIKQARDPAYQFNTVKQRSGDIFDVLMNGADGAQDTTIRARDVDPRYKERGAAALKNNHINGDLLLRFFDEGGNLQDLLSRGMEQDVLALFMELAQTLQVHKSDHIRNEHSNTDDVVDWGRQWIREVLLPLL